MIIAHVRTSVCDHSVRVLVVSRHNVLRVLVDQRNNDSTFHDDDDHSHLDSGGGTLRMSQMMMMMISSATEDSYG